ncbi:type II secretion system protein [Vampirovibrio sp.]|uniref:type II secretion system protein n=1 Tax=Vampirovibrio sp. TaxID=2717857 RepID=UPI003592FE54
MKPSVPNYLAPFGINLVETVLVIAVIAVLSIFAMVSFGGSNEERDAEMVITAQATLQSVVTQGATRLDMKPAEFKDDHYEMVLTAARASIGQKYSHKGDARLIRNDSRFLLNIPSTGRSAEFQVDPNGTVRLVSIGKFSPDKYKIDPATGILYKP